MSVNFINDHFHDLLLLAVSQNATKQLVDTHIRTSPCDKIQEGNDKHSANQGQSFVISVTDPDAKQTKIKKYFPYKSKSNNVKPLESVSAENDKAKRVKNCNSTNLIIDQNNNVSANADRIINLTAVSESGQNTQFIINEEELGINKVYVHDDENDLNDSPISELKSSSRTHDNNESNTSKSSRADSKIDEECNKVNNNHELTFNYCDHTFELL